MMKLSCAPLSRRQVTSSSSTSTFPKFLGPMNLRNASGFKYGALFILGDLFETCLGLSVEFLPSPSLELTCFGEAPLAAGAHSCFFLILPMFPLEVTRLITGEAPPGLHLLGSHGTGHLHLEDRIIGYGLLQITGDSTTPRCLLEMTHCHRHLSLPGVKAQDGSGLRPQPQGWWQ